MKRQTDDRLPQIRGEGGEIIDPKSDRALQELESDERTEFFLRLRATCRGKAREILDPDTTFDVGRGNRGMNQGAVQALATHFNLETWAPPEEEVVRWTDNEPFLQAHRAGEQVPPGVAPVPQHVSVKRTAYARTPWGHTVSRTGTCTSRGKHFWHSKGSSYNTSKYHDGAEHICSGIAETRAIARAVKAALMIGDQQYGEDEIEETDADRERKARKRQQNELLAAKQEWEARLNSLGILPDEEEAFRVMIVRVPDSYEEWDAGDYRTATKIADAKGKAIFQKTLEAYQERQEDAPTDDGQEPPEAEEETPEDIEEQEGAPPDETLEEEESNERAPVDPDEVDDRPEDEEDEAPNPEPEPEPTWGPEEMKQRKTLIQSIDGTCKLLGEDRAYAEDYAARKWYDGEPVALEELDTEDLARVDKAMSAELTDGGG